MTKPIEVKPEKLQAAIKAVKKSVEGAFTETVPSGADVVHWFYEIRAELGCCRIEDLPQPLQFLYAEASTKKGKEQVYPLKETFDNMMQFARFMIYEASSG